MNFGPRGTKLTVGIPGTGLSYQTKLGSPSRKRTASEARLPHVERPEPYHPASALVPAPLRPRHLGTAMGAGAVVAVVLLVIGLGGRTASTTREVAAVTEAVVPPAAASEQSAVRDVVEIAAPANIREAPEPDARVVGLAARHERYDVFGRSGRWTQVGRGTAVGWVGDSRLMPAAK